MAYEEKKFFYGRCPCCDMIIAVPTKKEKVYCCYCGEGFLARAALSYYGYQKPAKFITYTPVPPTDPADPTTTSLEQLDPSVPHMMTIKETAAATGISENGLRSLIKQKTIPVVQIGVKYLINYSTLCELINQGKLGY